MIKLGLRGLTAFLSAATTYTTVSAASSLNKTHTHLHKPLRRTAFFTTMAATPTTLAMLQEQPHHATAAKQLLQDVYGDWTDLAHFPKPMPAEEAGESDFPYFEKGTRTLTFQRRYLWTDAWGVLTFVGMAIKCKEGEAQEQEREQLLRAAEALVKTVHATLGQPRSERFPMAKAATAEEAAMTPHGYVGLRIGKERARLMSDAGMSYDGMYWHYIDKWIFALLRLSQALGPTDGETYLKDAEHLIKTLHPHFLQRHPRDGHPQGLYWKLNSDLAVIPGLDEAGPNDDALSGWLMYSLVRGERVRRQQQQQEQEGEGKGKRGGKKGEKGSSSSSSTGSPIEQEWQDLDYLAGQYVTMGGMRVSTDPLGWGLHAWTVGQFYGDWADPMRRRLQLLANAGPLDVQRGMQLPFRFYGALLGGRLLDGREALRTPGKDAHTLAERAMERVIEREVKDHVSDFGCINKVMLAAALEPWAFSRVVGEEVLDVPGGGGGRGEGVVEEAR